MPLNLTPEKASSDPRFYCHIVNGKPELKRVHLFQVIWVGQDKSGAVFNILKKRPVTSHLIFGSFYLLPLMLKFQIIDQKFQRRIFVSCVAQHQLAQHTPHSYGVYHIWFPSNKIPVELYLIVDLRDKVWLVYRAFKH